MHITKLEDACDVKGQGRSQGLADTFAGHYQAIKSSVC